MTAINKPSDRSTSAPSETRTKPKTATSNVQKPTSQPARKPDQASLSKDVGQRSNQAQTPNFQSWAGPSSAKNSGLKALSGETMVNRDHGDNVKSLQQHLNKSGAKLKLDGKFGPETLKAVESFQRQNKLAVDGKVGKQTMGALNKGPAQEAARAQPTANSTAPKVQPAVAKPEPTAARPEPAAAPKVQPAAAKPEPPAAPKAQPAAAKPEPAAAPKVQPAAAPNVQPAAARVQGQGGPQLAAAPADPGKQPPPKLPPGSYNAGQITPDQLNKLKSSKDPQERLLGQTIERARANYKDLIKNGSEIIANRNAGNGGSPVLTILPPGFDPNKQTRVHTHYHGWNSTVADPKSHEHGLTNRIEAIQKKAGPQTVFVLPEAANAKPGANKTSWGNVRSQADTTNQALRDAGVTNPGYRVVSAHSAGGQALQQSIDRNPKGSGLQADRLELLDSNYGSENSIARWAGTESGQKVRSVNYFHASNSHSDAGLRGAFGNRYHRANLGGHAHNQANTMIDTVPDL